MTVRRFLLALACLGLVAGAAFLARESETPGERIAAAAEKFLATLKAEQKKKAEYGFDSPERTRWFFTPQQDRNRKSTRKGLPLEDMSDAQKGLAKALLRASVSEAGFKKATTIMSLEAILAKLETKGSMVRDPEWYFFTVFGTPGKTGKWGWRVEGHHLSLNFTFSDGKMVGATPFFMGANPADVKTGDRKGLKALPETEKPFRDVVEALDADQRKAALQAKQFAEIDEKVERPTFHKGQPAGLAAEKMNEKQKKLLWTLIEGYANRMSAEMAAFELNEIRKAGLDKVHFAYAGGPGMPGQPYTYRVQGPTFVIEFLNVQSDSAGNRSNHIHSAWRKPTGDFGQPATKP